MRERERERDRESARVTENELGREEGAVERDREQVRQTDRERETSKGRERKREIVIKCEGKMRRSGPTGPQEAEEGPCIPPLITILHERESEREREKQRERERKTEKATE